jgi:disulfide bond formation protein DsbB
MTAIPAEHPAASSGSPDPADHTVLTARFLWFSTAGLGAALVLASLALTVALDLSPCYLCIFQRFLFIVIALFALAAAIRLFPRRSGTVVVLAAATGMVASGYQSVLQWQPAGTASCEMVDPGLVERFVVVLGSAAPWLFRATGQCENEELVLLWLSLANWAIAALSRRRTPDERSGARSEALMSNGTKPIITLASSRILPIGPHVPE